MQLLAACQQSPDLEHFVLKSSTGRAMRATAQDPDTAQLMGIDTNRIIVIAFAIGGFFAAVAAVAYGLKYGNVDYRMGFLMGLKAFTAAVLGGIGNLRGALVGGLLLGVVEVYGSTIWDSSWTNVFAFIVLVLVLMFRPTGLLGESLGKARA